MRRTLVALVAAVGCAAIAPVAGAQDPGGAGMADTLTVEAPRAGTQVRIGSSTLPATVIGAVHVGGATVTATAPFRLVVPRRAGSLTLRAERESDTLTISRPGVTAARSGWDVSLVGPTTITTSADGTHRVSAAHLAMRRRDLR